MDTCRYIYAHERNELTVECLFGVLFLFDRIGSAISININFILTGRNCVYAVRCLLFICGAESSSSKADGYELVLYRVDSGIYVVGACGLQVWYVVNCM